MRKYENMVNQLQQGIDNDELNTYVYSYPSKRSYRPFAERVTLDDLVTEVTSMNEINIYLHIPFCKYRCTYCTLFLTTKHDGDLRNEYVDRLIEHLRGYSACFKNKEVASIYFGGGTPTLLTPDQFERIFSSLYEYFPNIKQDCEITVEGSPDSMDPVLLDKLKSLGVNRMSMGIQTMIETELAHSGRPYGVPRSHQAINDIAQRFSHFNLDLIYGLTSQTESTWDYTLRTTLDFDPTTLSLYPVIARPLTNIDRTLKKDSSRYLSDVEKFKTYDNNVRLMKGLGYRQESFTRFTKLQDKSAYSQESSDFRGTPLLGLGAGARSYFGKYHFTTDYAVNKALSQSIIENFVNTPFDPDNLASHGIVLDKEELKRRYIILNISLSQLDGNDYRRAFSESIESEFEEEINAGLETGLIYLDGDIFRLSPLGFKYSNLYTKFFVSEKIDHLFNEYQPK